MPGANSIPEFRDLLRDGRCAVTSVPYDRWNHDLYLHPNPGVQGKSYTFAAGVLDDIWGFDLSAFNLSPREAALMDPQQRLLLQVVWEALEDAHIDPSSLSGERVGVYVGASSMDHGALLGRDPSLADPYMMTGNTLSLVANRISHAFDLRGPSFVVDTACSSSLVALDQARQALATGDIDTAVVAGVNLLLNPGSFIGFSAARMLSPAGLCQSFSDKADGYVRAEGCAAVILRNADEAPRRARAKLIDSEVNADGYTMNVALPGEEGQFQLLSRIYERSEITPDMLAFVEAHGTGTLVGDPVEAHALGRAISQHRDVPLPIGSVKTNVGHLEPASGLVGFLKTLVAFDDRRLPASLHAEGLNPHIDFEALNLTLAREAVDLTDHRELIAAVSSFGFGGVNAHCILQAVEKPEAGSVPKPKTADRIIVTSAFCEAALKQTAAQYAPLFEEPGALEKSDLVDQMWAGRGLHNKRLGVLADSSESAAKSLAAFAAGRKDDRLVCIDGSGRAKPTVFVYSGNGAQYSGMCRLALEHDAAYRDTFEQVDHVFSHLASWSLLEALDSDGAAPDISKGPVAQGLLFADQAAQTSALAARGIRPNAVLGHSGGEIAAAWACNALTLEQAINLMVRRSTLQDEIEGKGGMMALQASADETEAVLAKFDHADTTFPIAVAAVNSPRSVTLAGPKPELARFAQWVKREHRLACVKLDLNYPYHSVILDPLEKEFHERLAAFKPRRARIPYYSGTYGKKFPGTRLDVAYWWDNLRQPVQFQSAIEAAIKGGFDTFLEIGATPVLPNYILSSAKVKTKSVTVAHTLSKSDPETVNPIARAAMRAVLSGCSFDEKLHFLPPAGPEIELPTYPWQMTHLQAANSPEIERELGTSNAYHPLLGMAISSNNGVWRRDFDEHILPALRDHKIGDASILPATAFAEMAFASAHQAANQAPIELRDLDISAPVVLSGSQGLEVQTTADTVNGQVKVHSRSRLSQDTFREHMRAKYVALSTSSIAPDDSAPTPIHEHEDCSRWLYRNASRIGLEYGSTFRGVSALRVNGDEIEVELAHDLGLNATHPFQGFDPVQMDCILHGLIEAAKGTEFARLGQAFMPIRIGRIQVFLPGENLKTGRLRIRKWGTQSILVDVIGFNAAGHPVVRFEGLRLQATFLKPPIDFDQHAYHFTAHPALPTLPPPSINVTQLEKALHDALSESERSNDNHLLIAAATHQAVWRAFRNRSSAAGTYKLAEPENFAEITLLHMLSTLSLAEPDPEAPLWHIAESCDIPAASDIGHNLLAERPDLISEVSLLFHLTDAVEQILANEDDNLPTVETLFGREAVQGVDALNAETIRVLAAAISCAAEATPREHIVRIGLAGSDLRILEAMQSRHPGLELINILPAEQDGAPQQSKYRSTKWDDARDIDAIVILDPTNLVTDEFTTWINTALNAGGALFVLNQRKSPLAQVALVTAQDHLSAPQSTDRLKERLQGIDLKELYHHQLPDGASGGDLLIYRKPTREAQLSEVQAHPDVDCMWSRLWTDLHGANTKYTNEIFTVVEPEAAEAPILLFRGSGSTASLTECVLQLSHSVGEAAEKARSVTVILPQGAQFNGSTAADPTQHALWCSLRTIANEFPDLKIQVIDPGQTQNYIFLLDVFKSLDRLSDQETEIVLSDRTVLALRVKQGLPVPKNETKTGDRDALLRLERPKSGRLAGLKWASRKRPELSSTEVEIEIAATGLNYRDVMWAMGLLPEEALEAGFVGPTLGLECAGQVVRVGADVTTVQTGDSVIAFGPSCLSTHMISDETWVTKVPPQVPLDQAATLPVAYFTAHYALRRLGNLQRDETILIHGAAGGVGLAAIAVAQDVGAQVIATAGSPVKQQFLREIGVKHVLMSRDINFLDPVRKITDNHGVDVVLNSLAGPAMEASVGLVRPYGRFLELGKLDYYANTPIGVRPLKNNITYHGIDVDSLLADRPDIARGVLQEVMEKAVTEDYPPLPMTRFDGDDAIVAFRFMQRSAQIGKVVVTPPKSAEVPKVETPITDDGETIVFEPDPCGWHVLAGGLGGLGLELSEMLHLSGAKRLALLSRTGEMPSEIASRIEMMRADGSEVRVIPCDITDRKRLSATLTDLRSEAHLAAIYHAAMVLEDRIVSDIDAEFLERILPVKTTGLDNLDQETRNDNLQAFVAFTSVASMIGNYGQTAYVAANGYQEAVIKRRVASGLPGLAVALGAITDAGYLTRDKTLSDIVLQMSGNVKFPASVALNALGQLIVMPIGDPCVTVTPMNWSNVVAQLPNLRRPTNEMLRRLAECSGRGQNAGTLRAELIELDATKAVKRTIEFLKSEIANILRVSDGSLSASRPLAEYGMDSLMGVELGLAVQEALGDDLPMPTLGDGLTIEALATSFISHIHSGGALSDANKHVEMNEAALQALKSKHLSRPMAEPAE